jgi:hypothetical protein
VLDSNPYANEKTVPFVVRNVGGVKVGIVSFGYVPQDQDPSEYSFRKTVYSAYKQAREASDVLIVLDQVGRANADWITRNGPRLGAPDVVIGGLGTGARWQDEVVGKTHLVVPTVQLKQVGVVDITIGPNGERTVKTKRIQLDRKVAEDPAVAKRITEFLNKGNVPVTQTPLTSTAPITAQEQTALQTSKQSYYPPAGCKACHVREYEDWAASKHAKSIKTLVDARRARPECLPCHSEEYLRTQKVTTTADNIGGVDCQSCHIESLPHGTERKAVVNPPKVNPVKCLACHNKERSPSYDEQVYFAKVSHKTAQPAAPPD